MGLMDLLGKLARKNKESPKSIHIPNPFEDEIKRYMATLSKGLNQSNKVSKELDDLRSKEERISIPGPILAYRTWNYYQTGLTTRLTSISATYAWPAREPATRGVYPVNPWATAMPGQVIPYGPTTAGLFGGIAMGRPPARKPKAEEYGIYAWKHPAPSLSHPELHGGVWLWGDIFEHEKGYRAEFAYPAFLVCHQCDIDPDVSINQREELSFDELRELCDPLGDTLKRIADNYGIPLFYVEKWSDYVRKPDMQDRLLFKGESP